MEEKEKLMEELYVKNCKLYKVPFHNKERSFTELDNYTIENIQELIFIHEEDILKKI